MNKKMMIQQVILGAAMFAATGIAQAQTSTATIPTIDGGGTSTATSNEAVKNSAAPKLTIKYLGIFEGPGVDFAGAHQAEVYDGSKGHAPITLNNRPKFLLQTSENFEFGAETRFDMKFGANYNGGSNVDVQNSTYRLMANFKNVIKTDTLAVSFIPRVVVPSTNKQHEQHFRAGPEALINVDYAPKNTRFSFNTGMLYQYGIYGSDTAGAGYSAPNTSVFQPWLEADYQVAPKVQGFLAYWPEFSSQARQGRPMAADSNEVDLGAYFQVAKKWQIAPYVSMEPQGMDSSHVDRAMQLNIYFIGTVL